VVAAAVAMVVAAVDTAAAEGRFDLLFIVLMWTREE
jgi:hypothetical protein